MDSTTLALLSALMSGAVEGVAASTVDALTRGLQRLFRRGAPEASAAPVSTLAPELVAASIEKAAATDAELAREWREWLRALHEATPSSSNINSVSGQVTGSVVQAHTIHDVKL
ncbi:hypothetical protein QT381_15090 [Galbitalea sp. SE-J8]|uniref:hypothetical protein n=1 Tax=Galbitalea sp. SE-J8 TaxID=3054952 RepID=UPI00259D12DB|nr:hypothetical protein [Galbitalea sp. SE-J8]MDM4764329.1 hypothetical protein [Galbitalea sp. SE-J8]